MQACEAYIELMMQVIDGEATQQEEAALHAHLEQCETCRRLYEAYRAVDQSLQSAQEEPPEQLTAAIMNGIRAEKAQPKRWFQRYRFTMIAAAAAVVILVSAKIGGNYVKLAANTTEDTTAAAAAEAPAEPEIAAEFRSGTDRTEAPEAAMEDVAAPAEEPAELAEAAVEEAGGEGAQTSAEQHFYASEETGEIPGGDGFDAARIEAMEKAGYSGAALTVSGIDGAELEQLLPEAKEITLDSGEIAYEADKGAVDALVAQGKLNVAATHESDHAGENEVYWIILEP